MTRLFNFLRFDPDKFIKALGYRDPISSSKGLTVGGKEDALTNILIRENRFELYEDCIKFLNTRVNLDLASFPDDIWSH